MRLPFSLLLGLCFFLVAPPVGAQVGIGNVQIGVPRAGQVLDPLLENTSRITDRIERQVNDLAEQRLRRIDRLVRGNRDVIERDMAGNPSRRGILIVMGAGEEAVLAAERAGYSVIQREQLLELELEAISLSLPRGTSLSEGEQELRALMPEAEVTPDNLYFQAGGSSSAHAAQQRSGIAAIHTGIAVGIIDGAPNPAISVDKMQGFARGAGQASDHGSAVASLLKSGGVSRIKVADVYGSDPAGGNVMAITRALAWLVGEGVNVVTISLVGPENIVLARAVAAARQRGVVIVAAVGNDGPAAPPAYPASYDGVVAVTAVDQRERALIEAGRALHLDYAAPGADIVGMDRRGRSVRLRGTSYATPLVAARISHALARGTNWRRTVDNEAIDLGEPGLDSTYGRGLLCRGCGRR